MWLLLLACAQVVPEAVPPGPEQPQPEDGLKERFLRLFNAKVIEHESDPMHHSTKSNPEILDALPMPATVPFIARTRGAPATLVDERSQVSMVIEAVGVRLEVKRLLNERAHVRCIGCRSETSGWVQRNVLQSLEYPGNLPNDALAAFLEETSHPNEGEPDPSMKLLNHGVVESISGQWISPPWHEEPGYTGPILEIYARPSGFSLIVREEETEPLP